MQTIVYFLSLAIISITNALFTWKYVSRITDAPFQIAATAIVLCCPFLILAAYKYKYVVILQRILNSKKTLLLLVAGCIAAAILFFVLVPQERLDVDRYEMIRLFWDNFFAGRCPYCPRSEGTNIPGPFPFYFYIALPFYLIGEIGLFSLAGLLLFAGILYASKEFPMRLKNSILIVLLASPAFLYEISCRSTNFLNGALLLFCTLIICRVTTKSLRQVLYTGIATGFVLSTRSFAVLPVALAVVFTFKLRLISRNVSIMTITAIAVFLVTFVPVIVLCGKSLLLYNPFFVQASLAPPLLMIIVAFAAVLSVYRSRSIYTLSAITGFVLTLLAVGYSAGFIASQGFKTAILSSSVDITYFSLAMPFLLYGLGGMRAGNAGRG